MEPRRVSHAALPATLLAAVAWSGVADAQVTRSPYGVETSPGCSAVRSALAEATAKAAEMAAAWRAARADLEAWEGRYGVTLAAYLEDSDSVRAALHNNHSAGAVIEILRLGFTLWGAEVDALREGLEAVRIQEAYRAAEWYTCLAEEPTLPEAETTDDTGRRNRRRNRNNTPPPPDPQPAPTEPSVLDEIVPVGGNGWEIVIAGMGVTTDHRNGSVREGAHHSYRMIFDDNGTLYSVSAYDTGNSVGCEVAGSISLSGNRFTLSFRGTYGTRDPSSPDASYRVGTVRGRFARRPDANGNLPVMLDGGAWEGHQFNSTTGEVEHIQTGRTQQLRTDTESVVYRITLPAPFANGEDYCGDGRL